MANGATQVDTTLTLQITFNAPLDTTVRFPYPDNSFINMNIFPEDLYTSMDHISLSADRQTVFLHNYFLSADCDYMLIIADAVSIDGDSLAMPAVVSFSTGNSLPTATMTGTATMPSGDVVGSAVLLFTGPIYGNEEFDTAGVGVVTSAAGDYTLDYITPGTYWPAVIKNFYFDFYGMIFPATDGWVGFYDPDNNGVPDSIIVTDGMQLTGIDISMQPTAPITARFNYPAIADSGSVWADDAELIYIMAWDISRTGKSQMWYYVFHSRQTYNYRAWVTLGSLIFSLDVVPEDAPSDTTALPANWLDSPVIMDSAAVHGGDEFFALYPDALCEAFLANFELPYIPLLQNTPPLSRVNLFTLPGKIVTTKTGAPQNRDRQSRHFALSTQQYITPVWGIYYYSETAEAELLVFLNAVTGEYIPQFLPTETTARFNLEAANRVAQNWAADACLVAVDSYVSELVIPGKAMIWDYSYYSPGLDSTRMLIISNNMLILDSPPEWEVYSTLPLPVNWLDSDQALTVAELNGGSQYRAENDYPWMIATLSRGLYALQPDSAVWQIDYFSDTAEGLTLFVDALSGDYLPTVIKPGTDISNPQTISLFQNYPNPFNATTLIKYQLPKPANLSIKIYNQAGQLVRNLLDTRQQPGVHGIMWDGRDNAGLTAASGIYYYRLTREKFTQTRTMLIIR